MTEIKFRAWNYVEERFYYGEDYPPLEARHLELRDFFALTRIGEHPNGFKEDQEYTGLKDKNGKEIYEGDILEFGDYSIAKYGRCLHTVYWNEEDAGFYTRELGFQKLGGFPIDVEGEVIGNIYENKELLEVR